MPASLIYARKTQIRLQHPLSLRPKQAGTGPLLLKERAFPRFGLLEWRGVAHGHGGDWHGDAGDFGHGTEG